MYINLKKNIYTNFNLFLKILPETHFIRIFLKMYLIKKSVANKRYIWLLQIPSEAQAQLKEQILLSVQNEQKETIRRKVCEVAAEVARNLIDEDGNNQWPEFLQFLFQCANSPSPELKESALRMFTWVSFRLIFSYINDTYIC